MSVELARHAQLQVLSDSCALVLRTIALAGNENFQNACWLSQGRIGSASNSKSVSTVKRCLADLRDLGLIKIHKVVWNGRCLNAYTIDADVHVYWDRTLTWRKFVRQESEKRRAKSRQAGESREEYVSRLTKELPVPGKRLCSDGEKPAGAWASC